MLTAGELAQMRDVIESTLPGTAIIQRATTARDARGEAQPTWTAAGTVSCRWSPIGAEASYEIDQDDRATALKRRLVTVATGTDVTQADRLSIGGTVHSITGLRAPRDWELSRQIECVEVD